MPSQWLELAAWDNHSRTSCNRVTLEGYCTHCPSSALTPTSSSIHLLPGLLLSLLLLLLWCLRQVLCLCLCCCCLLLLLLLLELLKLLLLLLLQLLIVLLQLIHHVHLQHNNTTAWSLWRWKLYLLMTYTQLRTSIAVVEHEIEDGLLAAS